jgi:ubiquinone/menaquinone biosynthesis C-methylase UbiE
LHRWIFDYLLERADGSILELGSGPGHLWRRNLDRIPASFTPILSDVSHGMITSARRELSNIPVNFQYAVFDAQSLPLPSNSFNIVIANHMIYHIPDIPEAIEEMHRIISHDGCLLAATNGDDHLREIHDLVHSIEPSIIFGSRDLKEIHTIPFSMNNGSELLSAAFERVLKFKFDDELIITEVDPLLQYIISFPGNAREVFASEDKLSELKTTIEKSIRKDGAFYVTKSVGLFIAIKG